MTAGERRIELQKAVRELDLALSFHPVPMVASAISHTLSRLKTVIADLAREERGKS